MKDQKDSQELLDINENGKVEAPKKEEEEEVIDKSFNTLHWIFIIALGIGIIVFGILFIRNCFIFCQKMSHRILHKVKTVEEIYKGAGDHLIDMIKQNPKIRIGLASGGTPKGLYKYLIQQYKEKKVSFKDVTFYSLDEFCGLPKSHEQSYDYYMRSNFLNEVDAQQENIFLLNGEGELTDPKSKFEKYAEEYNKMLEEKPVDVQILSFGGNGHFGFNEKGTSFDTLTHVVELTDELRKEKSKLFENELNKTPYYSITQGVKSLMNAKEIIIIANGKGKAEGIKSLIDGEPTTDSPLSALIDHTGKVHIFTDEEACSLLRN